MHVARAIILMLLLAATLRGQDVTVTLPLDGHYRPGLMMPVRVVSTRTTGTLFELRGMGTIPTRYNASSPTFDAIFPWLIHSVGPTDLVIRTDDGDAPFPIDLKPLADDDRLVGVALARMPDDAWLQALFPGKRIVPVRINTADLVLGPELAWSGLDALVIDGSMLPKRSSQANPTIGQWTRRLRAWVTDGVTVVVRGDAANLLTLPVPWTNLGDSASDWLARLEVPGPRGYFNEDVYMLVTGWRPGRSSEFRAQLMLRAVLFAILVLIAALWRPRSTPWSAMAIAVCFAPAVAFWEMRQPALTTKSGTILTPQPSGDLLHDTWEYANALRGQRFAAEHPVFASPRHAEQLNALLLCNPAERGHVDFQLDLRQDATIVTLDRSVDDAFQLSTRSDHSIFTRFAEEVYESPSWRVKGVVVTVPLQMRVPGGDWDVVLLEPRSTETITR